MGVVARKQSFKPKPGDIFLLSPSFESDVVCNIDNTGTISFKDKTESNDVNIVSGETVNFICYKGFIVVHRDGKNPFCLPLGMIRNRPFQVACYGFMTSDTFELYPLSITKSQIESFLVKKIEDWARHLSQKRFSFCSALIETLLTEVSPESLQSSLHLSAQLFGHESTKTIPGYNPLNHFSDDIDNDQEESQVDDEQEF